MVRFFRRIPELGDRVLRVAVNYGVAARKELGSDYPKWREHPAPDSNDGSRMLPPLKIW